ncbi:hypothetical protein BSPLISOX_174 [uncultured Gammaproteobacteria bacterium]|jgi:hypothetical protein|nr:hypothetical protein [uncultured Gammaproteobacteria bacterium]CAC9435758.1 hypothetical protein [uncultured Gammaproteobacteria bacterium]VVH64549.1 hypothetical protein BSPLISOX_174 [uncultured Gammaproteobacteria bacterium]
MPVSQQTYIIKAQAKSAIFEYIEVFYCKSNGLLIHLSLVRA